MASPKQSGNSEEVSSSDDDSKSFHKCVDMAMEKEVLLEMLIAQAIIKLNIEPLSKNTTLYTVCSLKFADSFSDITWHLNIMRAWSDEIRRGSSSKWCLGHCISEKSLQLIERQVEERYKCLEEKYCRLPRLRFNRKSVFAGNAVTDILLNCYSGNICVYQGHDKLGYREISSGKPLFIRRGTTLHVRQTKPKFILCLNSEDSYIITAIVVPDSDLSNILKTKFNKSEGEILHNYQVIPTSFTGIGINVQQILERYWVQPESIQDELFTLCSNNKCVMQTDDKNGIVTVYCLRDHVSKVRESFNKYIETARNYVRGESYAIPFPHSHSHTKLVIGDGFEVKDTLVKSETRTIAIRSLDNSHEIPEVLQVLKELNVDHIQKSSARERERGIWGFATFKTFPDAASAVENLAPETFTLELYHNQPDIVTNEPVINSQKICYCFDHIALPNFKPKVSVSQMKNNPEHLTKNRKKKSKSTGNKKVQKPKKQVFAERQGPSPLALHIKQVHRKLLSKFRDASPGKFDLNINLNNNIKKTEMSLSVVFPDYKSSLRGMECLLGENIMGHVLSAPVDPDMHQACTFTIEMIPKVYKACRSMVVQKIENLKTQYGLSFTEETNSREEYYRFQITTKSPYNVAELQEKFASLLKPLHLEVTPTEVKFLRSEIGRKWCQVIENVCVCYIDTDTFDIYGSKPAKLKGQQEITECLKDTERTDTYKYIIDTSRLEGETVLQISKWNCDLFKEMYLDPENKFIAFEIEELDLPRDILGMALPIDEEYVVESLRIELQQERATHTETCETCYVDTSEYYILEACGHVYCNECLKTQIDVAVKNTQLPLICASDGLPFTYRDFRNICGKHTTKRKRIVKTGIRNFLATNTSTHKCCPKTNCDGIMKTAKTSSIHCCIFCGLRACGKCGLPVHQGMTCEDYFININNIRNWMKEDPINRRECPNCGMGIEKNGGCKNVTCIHCKKNICWKCLEVFENAEDCYAHLRANHGGIY